MGQIITGKDLEKIDKAPNYAYLDSHKMLHVWHQIPKGINAGRPEDPPYIAVDIDAFAGYACIGDKTGEARLLPDGKITCDAGFDVLIPVVKQLAALENLKITGASATLGIGKTMTLTANLAVTWESSNPKVASVDENGVVKALAAGSVTIIAKTLDGGATRKVAVKVM